MSDDASIASLSSAASSLHAVIGAERWKVRRLRGRLEKCVAEQALHCEQRHDKRRQRLERAIAEMHNRIFVALRCAVPSFQPRHEDLVLAYCRHVTLTPQRAYEDMQLLEAFNRRALASTLSKACEGVTLLTRKLLCACLRRDEAEVAHQHSKRAQADTNQIKSENTLRWELEKTLTTGAQSRGKYWSLWFFAVHNKVAEARVMLEVDPLWKFDVDRRDPDFGFTSLHYACKHGHVEMVVFLVGQGADVLAALADGRTCLHLAATYSGEVVIAELVVHGARVGDRDEFGMLPIDLARQNGNRAAERALQMWTSTQPAAPPPSDVGEDRSCRPSRPPSLVLLERRVLALEEGAETSDYSAKLRVLEKYACLNIKHGFNDDAIAALVRRFDLAKTAFLRVEEVAPASSLVSVCEELVDLCVAHGRVVEAVGHLATCVAALRATTLAPPDELLLVKLLCSQTSLSLSLGDDASAIAGLECVQAARLLCTRRLPACAEASTEVLPQLQLETECLERLGRVREACEVAEFAFAVARRQLGQTHPRSVALGLDQARLLLLLAESADAPDVRSAAVARARDCTESLLTELSSWNQNNAAAFQLLQRCVEYMARAAVMEAAT